MMMALSNKQRRDSPSYFFVLLISHGLLSIMVIIVLAGFGLRNTYRQQIFTNAAEDAERIVEAIVHFEGELFFDKSHPEQWYLHVDDDQLPILDERLRHLLKVFEISKIKIFAPDTRVVYSSDAAIIGQLDSNNPRLARALTGQIDSSLKHRGSLVDLSAEEGFDLDMVETYVPVISDQGELIGVIELYIDVTSYRQTISALIQRNLSILALVLALVFSAMMLMVRTLTRRLSMAQNQLKTLASTDALTGVSTRREIMAQGLNAGLTPSKRCTTEQKENSNGLMMLDIDLFKKINDSHGHLIGDLVLKIIAQRLVATLREQDMIGRFGGEEFLIILPNSSADTTRDLAERCRKHISGTPITCEGQTISVTASIGISCYEMDGGEQAFIQALESADKALYQAKTSGRNQIRSHLCKAESSDPATCVSCSKPLLN